MDDAGPRVQAALRIDLRWNGEEHRHDRRLQLGRQVERALVEAANRSGRDSLAFRTQVHGFARPRERAPGPGKDARALLRMALRNREERPHHRADDPEWHDLPQEATEEE